MQQELGCVQKDRQELENHRKMMKINVNVQRRGMVSRNLIHESIGITEISQLHFSLMLR